MPFEYQDYFSLLVTMVLWLIRQKLPWEYLVRFCFRTGLPWDALVYFISFLSACPGGTSLPPGLSPSPLHLKWHKHLSPETWTKSLSYLSHIHGDTCLQVNKCMHLNSQKKLYLPDTIWFLISFTLFLSQGYTKPLHSKNKLCKEMSK